MTAGEESIDFSRSYCWYVPAAHSIWVRIQAECICDVIDRETGAYDRYILGVRTQTGLRTDPPSDHLDPGYDFWMTFSEKFVYVKRNHASSSTNNPTRVPVGEFIETGWKLESVPARSLGSATDVYGALRAEERLTARTTFTALESSTDYRIEYPIKWAEGDPVKSAFRVETGPVLLLDPERVRAGEPVAFHDFTWAYLDYHDGESVRCLVEQPTSVLTGSTYSGSAETPPTQPRLTPGQRSDLERFLFESGSSPIPAAELRSILSTQHYSGVRVQRALTEMFSIDGDSNE